MQRSGKIIEKEPVLENKKKLEAKKNNFMLDVSDINLKQKKIKGERCTNPLNPTYIVPSSNEPGWTRSYGEIAGSKPENPKENIKCPDFCLNVKDIPGAVSRVGKSI